MTDFFKNLLSNGELQEENERLKEEIKQLHNGRNTEELYTLFGKPIKYWEELNAENERLKQGNKELAHYLACMTEQRNKANTCLQEIKAIAAAPKPFIDFSEIKTATEVGYDYAAICNELELRLHKVLELITKAEEE